MYWVLFVLIIVVFGAEISEQCQPLMEVCPISNMFHLGTLILK